MSKMEEEKWAKIPEYPTYEISSYGFVRNTKDNNIISPWIPNNGYYYIRLQSNTNKPLRVHTLVADAFVNKPDNFNERITVNHIDGNPVNNNYTNLEWVTYSGQQLDVNKRNPNKTLPAKRHPVIGSRNDEKLINLIKTQIKNGRTILGITIDEPNIILDESIYKPELQFDIIHSTKSFDIGAEQYFINLGFGKSRITYNNTIYGYDWKPIGVEQISDEEWKQISDIQDSKRNYAKYIDYQISNYGRIKTPKNEIRDTRMFKTLTDGSVKTYILKDNLKIHELVMLSFNEPRPSDKHLVHHIDGIKINNHYSNLQWKTMSEKCKKINK